MLAVIHMGHHGHDAGDLAALGHGVCHEDGDGGVAGVVPGAADAVVDAGAVHLGGVDVPVDVRLHGGVHGDDAETADHLAVVGDLGIPQDELAPVGLQVAQQTLHPRFGEGEGGGGGHVGLAGVDEIQNAVLHDLGEEAQMLKIRVSEPQEHGVCHRAHAGLQRAHVGGEPPRGLLGLQEGDDVPGDLLAHLILRRQRPGLLRQVGDHHGGDLLRRAAEIGHADALCSVGEGDGLTMRGIGQTVDVMEALQLRGLAEI